LGAEAKRGEASAFRGSRAESDVLDLRVLDLLDFASERAGGAGETDACWILVGFHAALNVCSDPVMGGKHPLSGAFASWAVTGSNRRPLRCKRNIGNALPGEICVCAVQPSNLLSLDIAVDCHELSRPAVLTRSHRQKREHSDGKRSRTFL
jgi:hypothetical protein